MRKHLWIIAFVFAAIVPPNVQADTITDYTINFSLGSGTVATLPTGSFGYDYTTNQFTFFTVVWNGVSLDFRSVANAPTIIGVEPTCLSGATGPQATLAMMLTCGQPEAAGQPTYWSASGASNSTDLFIETDGPSASPGSIHILASSSQSPLTNGNGGGSSPGATVATPEPGTGLLMLVGIGLIGLLVVMRKHIPQGLPQTP